jgi:hypothetical protein
MGRIYLYSHWGGSELPTVLQKALAKRWRWADPAYLARIIFDEMIEGEGGNETGYGISTFQPDNEHLILVVNCQSQTVTAESEGGSPLCEWSLAAFVALEDPEAAVNALNS